MKQLFAQFKDAGEDWYASEIYLTHQQTSETLRTGEHHYVTLKDLRKEHGDTRAEELAADKQQKQQTHGDYCPRVPYVMVHPDWPKDKAGGLVSATFVPVPLNPQALWLNLQRLLDREIEIELT